MRQILITSQEVIKLSQHVVTSDCLIARTIFEDYLKECEKNPLYLKEFAFAAVWNAGRIQGIREERFKRGK